MEMKDKIWTENTTYSQGKVCGNVFSYIIKDSTGELWSSLHVQKFC